MNAPSSPSPDQDALSPDAPAQEPAAEGATAGGGDYRVELDAYAGPMDLLLYLVRRHEIDLQDIPIAKLTDQYLQHLERIKQIDIDRAGEFLVMAATLLEIKSLLIVPHTAEQEEQAATIESEDLPATDPRYELVQQLLAYKKFKDAAVQLEKQHDRWQQRYRAQAGAGKPPAAADDAEPVEIDLEDVSVTELAAAFSRLLESIGHRGNHEVTYDDTPISMHAEDIVDRLANDTPGGRISLQALFQGRRTRSELIGLFLATLELVRQKKIAVLQPADGGEIELMLRSEAEQLNQADDREADWRNPDTGEIEYDYPDELSRRRMERRARLRETIAAKRAAGDTDELDDLDAELAAELEDDQDDAASANNTDEPADAVDAIDVEIREHLTATPQEDATEDDEPAASQ